MKVQPAEAYDFADGVVWTLVLGEDAEGQTDLIQLLGINFRNGNAAAIGIPRDSWFELSAEEGEDRINTAYDDGRRGAGRRRRRATGRHRSRLRAGDRHRRLPGDGGHPRGGRRRLRVRVPGRGLRPPGAPRGEHLLRPGGAGLRRHPDDVGAGRLRPFPQPPGAAARPPRGAPRQGRRAGLHRGARPRRRRRHRHRQPVAAGPLPPAQRADLGRPGEGVGVHRARHRRHQPARWCHRDPGLRARPAATPTTSAPTPASTRTAPRAPRSPRRTRCRPRGPARSPGRGARRAAWRRRCWRGCAPS